MSAGRSRIGGRHELWTRIGLSLVLTACGGVDAGSSTTNAAPGKSPPELPPNTALKDLSAAQAEALCEWEDAQVTRGECRENAILAAGFTAQISSSEAVVKRARDICAAELEACTAPDHVATGILRCLQRTLGEPDTCEVTVRDVRSCIGDLVGAYASEPECAALTEGGFRQALYRMSPASCAAKGCNGS